MHLRRLRATAAAVEDQPVCADAPDAALRQYGDSAPLAAPAPCLCAQPYLRGHEVVEIARGPRPGPQRSPFVLKIFLYLHVEDGGCGRSALADRRRRR